jgi:hypothetical protein
MTELAGAFTVRLSERIYNSMELGAEAGISNEIISLTATERYPLPLSTPHRKTSHLRGCKDIEASYVADFENPHLYEQRNASLKIVEPNGPSSLRCQRPRRKSDILMGCDLRW